MIDIQILASGIVYRSRPDLGRGSCAFPAICATSTGRWWCGFRAAPVKAVQRDQQWLTTFSDDEGATWSEPAKPFGTLQVEDKNGEMRGGALTALPDGRLAAALYWLDHTDPDLPLFNPETQGLTDSRPMLSVSPDGGFTWPRPALVSTSPFPPPTPITGPILLLANGDWAFQVELNKHYHDTRPWEHAAVFKFSSDEGTTWPRHSVAAKDPRNAVFYWDQRPAVLSDGRIFNVFWTYDQERQAYLNIHTAESRDNGTTWSPPRDSGVPGQPAAPVELGPGGPLALAYMDRTAKPTLRLRLSLDGGHSWPAETQRTLVDPEDLYHTPTRNGVDALDEMTNFAFGLPQSAPLPGSRMLLTYYAGPHPDRTNIHWLMVGL